MAGERLAAARHNMCQRNVTLVRDVLRLFSAKYRHENTRPLWPRTYIPSVVKEEWERMCDDTFGPSTGVAPPTYGTGPHGHLYRIVVRASYHWDSRLVDRKLRRLETCSKCACSLKTIASFFGSAEQPNCRGCSHNAADVALYPADQAKR